MKRKMSIKYKLYLFIILTILLIASITILFSYITNSNQIDSYYKKITTDNAKNFASRLDVEFIQELRDLLRTKHYQTLRQKAEDEENEDLIKDYLIEHNLWDKYEQCQNNIHLYIENMSDIKYLYVMDYAGVDAIEDMYIIDDTEEPIYESGWYEPREPELMAYDINKHEPTISNSEEWGWLCSDYYPVYNSNNELVCIVGCDVDVEDMMTAKHTYLISVITNTLLVTLVIILGAIFFISILIVNPLNAISKNIKRFVPSSDTTEANVINLNLKGHNEITDIYDNIRSMQISIVDQIKNNNIMQKDIEQQANQINKLNAETFRDALTHVGNKGAYLQKAKELNIKNNNFAIVMVDINDLKQINDLYGHKAGDLFIQGCCKIICNTFKHSPVYRIGGDEFVVVIENEDYPNRHSLFEKLKLEYKISYHNTMNSPWEKFSASCGMAENSSDDSSVELVFKRADEAMYKEKTKFREKYGSYR